MARFCAALVAFVWALFGLGDALATGLGRGLDVATDVSVAVNGALLVCALLAAGRIRFWRRLLVTSALAVTVVRIVQVAGTGDWWLLASIVAMFVAIAAVTAAARGSQ